MSNLTLFDFLTQYQGEVGTRIANPDDHVPQVTATELGQSDSEVAPVTVEDRGTYPAGLPNITEVIASADIDLSEDSEKILNKLESEEGLRVGESVRLQRLLNASESYRRMVAFQELSHQEFLNWWGWFVGEHGTVIQSLQELVDNARPLGRFRR